MTSTVLVSLLLDVDAENNISSTVVAAEARREIYDAEILDELIREVFSSVLEQRYVGKISELKPLKPEVSVALKLNEGMRPSFHLSSETIRLISEAGADLDFDPYVFN